MIFFKGHFDGKSIILDEPAALDVGQEVDIVIRQRVSTEPAKALETPFSPDFDPSLLPPGVEYNERDYVEAVVKKHANMSFVREIGNRKGEIWIADDFDETPPEFEEYM